MNDKEKVGWKDAGTMENKKLEEWLQGKGILNLTDLTEYLMEYPDEEDTPLYCLSDFIEQMPVTRESVEELKECISDWEDYDLITGLLGRFPGAMTDEEMDEYVDLYHHVFTIPLDEWIEDGIEWEKHMRRIKAAKEKD